MLKRDVSFRWKKQKSIPRRLLLKRWKLDQPNIATSNCSTTFDEQEGLILVAAIVCPLVSFFISTLYLQPSVHPRSAKTNNCKIAKGLSITVSLFRWYFKNSFLSTSFTFMFPLSFVRSAWIRRKHSLRLYGATVYVKVNVSVIVVTGNFGANLFTAWSEKQGSKTFLTKANGYRRFWWMGINRFFHHTSDLGRLCGTNTNLKNCQTAFKYFITPTIIY